MKKDALTKHEWMLMEVLWESSVPLLFSEIKERMKGKVDWQKSTYLTYIKRLADYGYIGYETEKGVRAYYPEVKREECVLNESRQMLGRMTGSSTKLFLTNMITESNLSGSDINDLEALISQLKSRKDD